MPRKQPDHIIAVPGATAYKRTTNKVTEEWHPQLFGRAAVRQYREMFDNDPVIGGGLDAVEDLIRQATWEFVSPDESSIEGKEWADIANTMLTDMESTWQEFLSDVLLMLPFGWGFFVDTYKIRRGEALSDDDMPIAQLFSEYDDGLIGWRDISIRSQESFWEWKFDHVSGKAKVFTQRIMPSGELVDIPVHRGMLFKLRNNKGSPEGRSALRRAYRSWFMLKRIQEIEAIGAERDLAGMPHMQLPVSMMTQNAGTAAAAARADWEEKIQKIRMDQLYGLVTPSETNPDGTASGYKFGLVSAGGRRPIDVNEIVKRYESRIAISLASEFMLLGQDKVGSFALHSDKTSLFSFRLGAIMDSIAQTINRGAVRRLMRLNNVDRRLWPVLEHGDVEREKAAEVITAFQNAAQAGLVVPTDEDEAHVRQLLDMPQRGVEDMPMSGAGPAPVEQLPEPQDDPIQMNLPIEDPDVSRETPAPDFWTVAEAAENLRVSELTIRGAVKRGQLPGIKIGNSFRVSRRDAENLVRGM